MTLQAGYGVVEIPVGENSELCGKTLQEAQLRDRDVSVLTIQRDSVTIPNPRGSRGVHRYAASDFGLDVEEIRERFAEYVDEFGVHLAD